ncbi:MAG: hypothetical protein Ct9H90mP13_00670 [Pseudomonadota bacterium]|nr:MAG: hypothetical protein Ct9H90mP13_00670 [Pseudomonadota bacterium]
MISRHGGRILQSPPGRYARDTGEIMDWLKFTVAAFGGISLLVGGVGIFTIMTVAVNEKKSEIGIMRAMEHLNQESVMSFCLSLFSLNIWCNFGINDRFHGD